MTSIVEMSTQHAAYDTYKCERWWFAETPAVNVLFWGTALTLQQSGVHFSHLNCRERE